MPDFIFAYKNWKTSGLERNIIDLSNSYRSLFFNKENFSYFLENIYLILLFSLSLLIIIIDGNKNIYSVYFTVTLVIFLRLVPSINRVLGQVGLISYGLKSLSAISRRISKNNNLTKVTFPKDNSKKVVILLDNKKLFF